MSKSSHFTGQPIYSQLLSLLDKCQIMRLAKNTLENAIPSALTPGHT